MSFPALDFKLSIVRYSDGQPLPVLDTPGGKQYVISEEGCEYKVVLTTGSRFPHSAREDIRITAHLQIDGRSVGYSKFLRPGRPADWEGFCISGENGPSHYRRFKFAKADPSQDRGPQVADPDHIKAGRITVKITKDAVIGERSTDRAVGIGGSSGGAAMGHLPEGKKFFLAPSLKTDQGKHEAANTRWSRKIYMEVLTLGTLELRYETASTLLLRKTLDSANPAHRRLLAGSRDPTLRALLRDGDSEGEEEVADAARQRQQRRQAPAARRAAASGGGGSGPGTRVKRERGEGGGAAAGAAVRVKREPGGGGGGGGGGFVDLTKPPDAPLVVGGRAVGGDDIAVCDLLDSEDEGAEGGGGARWEVRKRQAVEVEPTNA